MGTDWTTTSSLERRSNDCQITAGTAVSDWLQSLIVDGIVAGCGAVFGLCSSDFCLICLLGEFFGRHWLYEPDCLCYGSAV